ncbi:MAG: chemoreceptor glutamine deamidase CheD [bacterium]
MYRRFDKRLNVLMSIIQPGEHFVVSEHGKGIGTVLGSCIAVCLFDPSTGIGGMNHFMLPGDVRNEEIFNSRSGRYGMFAMEKLINDMMKKGASRERLKAKIFGGGNVIDFRKSDGDIPTVNINFAKMYLSFEEIPIVASDVGGTTGRKIIFLPEYNGRVLMKKLKSFSSKDYVNKEKQYKATVFKKKKRDAAGGVTLFSKK